MADFARIYQICIPLSLLSSPSFFSPFVCVFLWVCFLFFFSASFCFSSLCSLALCINSLFLSLSWGVGAEMQNVVYEYPYPTAVVLTGEVCVCVMCVWGWMLVFLGGLVRAQEHERGVYIYRLLIFQHRKRRTRRRTICYSPTCFVLLSGGLDLE